MELIDREIDNAQKGLSASIVIKLNNLEEKVMIAKLYDASRAGVSISLIVRGICCFVPVLMA
jgi:polyphosphate kinase